MVTFWQDFKDILRVALWQAYGANIDAGACYVSAVSNFKLWEGLSNHLTLMAWDNCWSWCYSPQWGARIVASIRRWRRGEPKEGRGRHRKGRRGYSAAGCGGPTTSFVSLAPYPESAYKWWQSNWKANYHSNPMGPVVWENKNQNLYIVYGINKVIRPLMTTIYLIWPKLIEGQPWNRKTSRGETRLTGLENYDRG